MTTTTTTRNYSYDDRVFVDGALTHIVRVALLFDPCALASFV
jgi:hypothetical protein